MTCGNKGVSEPLHINYKDKKEIRKMKSTAVNRYIIFFTAIRSKQTRISFYLIFFLLLSSSPFMQPLKSLLFSSSMDLLSFSSLS